MNFAAAESASFLSALCYFVFSVNDAGKELPDHPGRVAAFLDFLGAPPDDPRRGEGTLYSSHDFGEAPKKVLSPELSCGFSVGLASAELVESRLHAHCSQRYQTRARNEKRKTVVWQSKT